MSESRRLYHYTCDHGARWINKEGWLRPHPQPMLGGEPLLWLTDLDVPVRDVLGLTSKLLSCDRTAHRYEVVTDAAVWWPRYARGLTASVRRSLEFAPGAMPMHWWVSFGPIAVTDEVNAA